ncbi:MAG: YCF48-related protein [Actinomycetes bacterium]
MIARTGCGFRHFTILLLFALSLCLAGGLLPAMQAQAGSRDARPTAQSAPAPGASYVAGEVLVRLRAGASRSGKTALASSLGAAHVRDLRVQAILPPGQRIVLIKSATLTGDALVKSALQNPNVSAASLNYRLYADAITPNDPLFPLLWGLNNTGQTGGAPGADISAPEAWSTTTGSADVVVADIDTGVAYSHPDLAANMWHNPGEIPANGIDDEGNGYIDDVYGINAVTGSGDPYDEHGHGTHTSGTAAAVGNNGVGIAGVAWQARIMALKFLSAAGPGTEADAITCIDYVVNEKRKYGVNVVAINASWGGDGYNPLLRTAINAAGAAGIVFCAAAGNGGADQIGDDNDTTPFYPASYDCANIISVAATDDVDALAEFSNYGATSVDLGAPGVGILSTAPAVALSFMDVAFPDAAHGWAVGDAGSIVATTNGGATWSAQSSRSRAILFSVDFTDATHGWAVGDGGAILATTDGGATWSAQSSGTTELLYAVDFTDATHGWAVGYTGAILATTDGGATWSAQTSGVTTWLHGVVFSDAAHGWAVGEGGVILATTNGGATWNAQSSGSGTRLYDVAFTDADHAWVVGMGGAILATTNGGATWNAQSSGTEERLRGVAFTDAAHGWAAGWGGIMLATTNGGATWTAQSSGTSADLEAVAFSDAEEGRAVGGRGTVLATTDAGATWGAQSVRTGGWYLSWSGTSMATPQVTGAVALCAAQYPSETMTQRVQRILDSVDPLTSLSGITATGGRLNVAAAVDTAGAPAPAVFGFTPTFGPAGTFVTVFGTAFSGAIGPTSVAFNGVAASFTVLSATRITAIVPRRATSGRIAVTTVAGTGTSMRSFIVVR